MAFLQLSSLTECATWFYLIHLKECPDHDFTTEGKQFLVVQIIHYYWDQDEDEAWKNIYKLEHLYGKDGIHTAKTRQEEEDAPLFQVKTLFFESMPLT